MDERVVLLMVDDEPAILQSLKRVFRGDPYEVLTTESGAKGLEQFATGVPVRVVISDYRMPGMNGVEFLKEVFERSPETVRIILSGYADKPVLLEAVKSGRIYKYLAKPWNDDQLRSTVRKGIELQTTAWKKSRCIEELFLKNSLLAGANDRLQEVVADRTAFIQKLGKAFTSSQDILNNLGPGIVCVGSDRVILLCNDAATTWLRTPRHSLIGQPVMKVFSPELAEFVNRVLTTEATASLYFRQDELSVRGVRLIHGNQDFSAVLFI